MLSDSFHNFSSLVIYKEKFRFGIIRNLYRMVISKPNFVNTGGKRMFVFLKYPKISLSNNIALISTFSAIIKEFI
ncbi:hypothetical protein RCL_jg11084.t1 [Rhizophagus clarus]|uniref:Uncharacterized protein n=1 Tax=Rhizophagus clarus TaxID=94130 RepID=A0A8H3MEN5_9GLOM|nr:hypothetical protein RCL_jg11084.t1 [Rhizophagus clarus]